MNLVKKNFDNQSQYFENNPSYFAILISSIVFIIGLIGILNHAMWRDELNAWLVARDSQFPLELFSNIHYEGHPPLWYLCLSFLKSLTLNPVIMQGFHLGLAVLNIGLFVYYAPFTPWQKLFFSLGYLPFYEYLLISRNYALGLLFLTLFCIVYQRRTQSYRLLALILSLMANTNAYGLFISMALALTLVIEYQALNWAYPTLKMRSSRGNLIQGILIYLTGLLISIYFLIPPQDSQLAGGGSQWFFAFDIVTLGKSIGRIWNSYMAVLLFSDGSAIECIGFGLFSTLIIIGVVLALRKKPFVLLFYTIGTGIILLFTYLKFPGSPRHYGHLYLIFIFAFWLQAYYPDAPKLSLSQFPKLQPLTRWIDRKIAVFLTFTLILQLIAGLVSFSRDLVYPYSASKATATYLKNQALDQKFIVGSEDYTMAPLAGYLQRQIYYPETQSLGSFVLFTQARQIMTDDLILEQVYQKLTQDQLKDILLILNHEITASNPQLQIELNHQETKGLIFNEKYYLYLVQLT